MSNLKVAVRVRPLSDRELQTHNSVETVASVEESATISVTNIKVPKHHAGDSRQRVRKYIFDYCFDEASTQEQIFSMVEDEVSKSLSLRYNVCVLAYGQSATGKTYTMMGSKDEPGVTPRLCENIFKYFHTSSVTEDEIKHTYTSVSYLEIYNERVQDLLISGAGTSGKALKVREHPRKGPYVQGLSEQRVDNTEQLLSWLALGNGNRQVASTWNNRCSSRSHSVFTITCTQDSITNRLHLVDLAGSERVHTLDRRRNASRFKEGANINRSLVALGNVICALSDQSGKQNRRKRFVPYRDSVLTWLLKDTLGGNSKTVMIATISPSSSCYSETVNTLRFGQRAKQIVNQPIVNEDPKEKLIRELRAEVIRLRELLHIQNGIDTQHTKEEEEEEDMSDPLPTTNSSSEEQQNTNSSIESIKELNELTSTDEMKIEIKSDENSTKPIHVQTDTLIPVMDITSTVAPKIKLTRLSRTNSVDYPTTVLRKVKKDFGSHETLTGDNEAVKPTSKMSSSRSGSISESSGKSTPNMVSKKRAEIVAAVTQRLYSQKVKVKKTEEKGIVTEPFVWPQVRSNARLRLQELTQRALRASKRKVNIETQTHESSTVRLKEKSTDVQDMEIALLEMKHVAVDATVNVRNACVDCHVQSYNGALKLTRSCASQTDELLRNFNVSFTKYLQSRAQPIPVPIPIYTSSVNINVSRDFRKDCDVSDDSLEDFNNQNVKFSTPDLISNHNSLENQKSTILPPISIVSDNDVFTKSEFFATSSVCSEFCNAKQSTVPELKERISKIYVPVTHAPQICKSDEFIEVCSVLNCKRKQQVPVVIKCENREKFKPMKRFRSELKLESESGNRNDLFDILQKFMKETSTLMSKLNSTVDQIHQNRKSELPTNLFINIHPDASSSVLRPPTENRFEQVLKNSCNKLEECVKLVEHKSQEKERLKPFSADLDWKYSTNDYSSLETTTQSASDYGSLPRHRKSSFRNYYSPKAYMKQLVALRKQIVQTSRNDFLDDLTMMED